MKNELGWDAEVYTKGPNGETGWDIKWCHVQADTREEAKRKVAEHFGSEFDCIITLDNLDYC